MNVNSLNINHEKTLLLISTNEGFLVYETTFFTLIYDSSKHDYEIGPLKFASPYFDSQLVLISGTSENIRIPENQISVWNSELNKSIAEVKFKENFNFFLIGKFTLAVFLPFKLILLDFLTLRLIYSVTIPGFIPRDTSSINTSDTLCYPVDSKIILIRRIGSKVNMQKIKTEFQSIKLLAVNATNDLMILRGTNSQRIHIYAINRGLLENDIVLIYCIELEYPQYDIIKVDFSTNKFLSIYYETNTIHIYKLNSKHKRQSCACVNEMDYKSRLLIFLSMVRNILLTSHKDAFAMYRLRFEQIEGQVSLGYDFKPAQLVFGSTKRDSKEIHLTSERLDSNKDTYRPNAFSNGGGKLGYVKKSLLYFDCRYMNEIVHVNSLGNFVKLKFNSIEGGYCWIFKSGIIFDKVS